MSHLQPLITIGFRAKMRMAGLTGLEPAASSVTGWRYNQLNYNPNFLTPDRLVGFSGGRYKDRTCDPRLVRPLLYQLS